MDEATALLAELDRIARDYDPHEYGLPVYSSDVVPRLVAAVEAFRADAVAPLHALLRDFLANNAYSSTADWCDCRADESLVCEHMAAHRMLEGR